ncbi:MAG TPA: DUF4397 domain-containing protein [Gammaproteobacteria bacterium]|nr:DUF4397 domain-containing protein [Gammaproteobacteria bacterium]
MNLRLVASCGFVCAALLLSGCDSGRQAPGKVTVQVLNAAPRFASLQFQREHSEREFGEELFFRDARSYLYDADTYDFYVTERTLRESDPGRIWTFAPTLEERTNYTFVLAEAAGEVQPFVIATPEPTADDARIVLFNAADGLPAMDLYLERPGVGIAGATPRGTLNALEQVAPPALPSGDYELFLTAAGNPADVLLTSPQFNLPAGTTSTFVVVPDSGQTTALVSVMLIQSTPIVLFDRNAPAQLRGINAATDQAPRDLAVDSQFSPPLLPAMPFAEPTAHAPITVGAVKVNVTPVGNPGVLEIDTQFNAIIGQRVTALFTGPAGALLPIFAADDLRRIHREAKLRLMNAAARFPGIDFVITLPDGDPNQAQPVAQLLAPGVSDYVPLYPGEYDLYLFQAGTTTVVSGPTRIRVADGGIYAALALDGPDTSTASVRLLDDFVP